MLISGPRDNINKILTYDLLRMLSEIIGLLPCNYGFFRLYLTSTNHYFSNVIPFVDTHPENYIALHRPGIDRDRPLWCPGIIILQIHGAQDHSTGWLQL